MPEIKTRPVPAAVRRPGHSGGGTSLRDYFGRLSESQKVGRPPVGPAIRYSDKRHKLTTRSIVSAMAERFPQLGVRGAEAVWEYATQVLRQTLLQGHPVSLHEVCTLYPMTRAATRAYHPGVGRTVVRPPARYLHVKMAVSFDREFVPPEGAALKSE